MVAISLQDALVKAIDGAVSKVVPKMDNHGDENGFTAALGQVLTDTKPISVADKMVTFDYRRLNDKTEEPAIGADGGLILSIQTRGRLFEKYVLFQAKKLPQPKRISSLRMPTRDAQRFRDQLLTMNSITDAGVVGLFYTRAGVYVVDGDRLVEEAKSFLRAPLAPPFWPLKLGTYLGKWVATCKKGGTDADIVARIRRRDGFLDVIHGGLGHLFEASIGPRARSTPAQGPGISDVDDGEEAALPPPRPSMMHTDVDRANQERRRKS